MRAAGLTYYRPVNTSLTNQELMLQYRPFFARVARLTSAVALAACTTATDPTPIATITLLPGFDSIEVGQTYSDWVLTVKDAAGVTLTGRTLTWESSNTAIATVDASTGLVTGVSAPSEAFITVSGEGKVAQSRIKVIRRIVSIVATPDSFDLPLTTTRTINVQLVGSDGVAITNRVITWSSGSPGVAVVSATGVVTAVSQGTASIFIDAGTKRATVRVRVVAEPVSSVRLTPLGSAHIVRLTQTRQFTAECLNAAQQVLSGRTIIWNSSNPLVGSVSGSGVVTAHALGTTRITATCDNSANASTDVTVTPIPVSSVTISPPGVSLSLSQPGSPQAQLLATAKDSAGNTLSLQGRQVAWFSNNIPVADVSQAGVVTGKTIGSAQITVTVDGITSAPVLVDIQAFFSLSSAFDVPRRRQNPVGLR
jgi:trimeric autotransporter adhesin